MEWGLNIPSDGRIGVFKHPKPRSTTRSELHTHADEPRPHDKGRNHFNEELEEISDSEESTTESITSDFKKLFEMIVGFFPQAKSKVEQGPSPRCLHEDFFVQENAEAKEKLHLTRYDRTVRIMSDVSSRFNRSMEEEKKLGG